MSDLPIVNIIGPMLRELRGDRKLVDIARLAGTAPDNLGKIEKGVRVCGDFLLYRLLRPDVLAPRSAERSAIVLAHFNYNGASRGGDL